MTSAECASRVNVVAQGTALMRHCLNSSPCYTTKVAVSRDLQARAADELDPLPEESAPTHMLAGYSVMRDQAWACGQ